MKKLVVIFILMFTSLCLPQTWRISGHGRMVNVRTVSANESTTAPTYWPALTITPNTTGTPIYNTGTGASQTISAAGSYYLAEDIHANGSAIYINAPSDSTVTIRMNGHKVVFSENPPTYTYTGDSVVRGNSANGTDGIMGAAVFLQQPTSTCGTDKGTGQHARIKTIDRVTDGTITYVYGRDYKVGDGRDRIDWSPNGPGSIEPKSCKPTNIALTSNELTVTCTNSFPTGMAVKFVNLTSAAASWLNGQTVTIDSANATQFTAPFTHADYASTPELSTDADAGQPYTVDLTYWEPQVGIGSIDGCDVFMKNLHHVYGHAIKLELFDGQIIEGHGDDDAPFGKAVVTYGNSVLLENNDLQVHGPGANAYFSNGSSAFSVSDGAEGNAAQILRYNFAENDSKVVYNRQAFEGTSFFLGGGTLPTSFHDNVCTGFPQSCVAGGTTGSAFYNNTAYGNGTYSNDFAFAKATNGSTYYNNTVLSYQNGHAGRGQIIEAQNGTAHDLTIRVTCGVPNFEYGSTTPITSITRDANGLVTVNTGTTLTDLPAGRQTQIHGVYDASFDEYSTTVLNPTGTGFQYQQRADAFHPAASSSGGTVLYGKCEQEGAYGFQFESSSRNYQLYNSTIAAYADKGQPGDNSAYWHANGGGKALQQTTNPLSYIQADNATCSLAGACRQGGVTTLRVEPDTMVDASTAFRGTKNMSVVADDALHVWKVGDLFYLDDCDTDGFDGGPFTIASIDHVNNLVTFADPRSDTFTNHTGWCYMRTGNRMDNVHLEGHRVGSTVEGGICWRPLNSGGLISTNDVCTADSAMIFAIGGSRENTFVNPTFIKGSNPDPQFATFFVPVCESDANIVNIVDAPAANFQNGATKYAFTTNCTNTSQRTWGNSFRFQWTYTVTVKNGAGQVVPGALVSFTDGLGLRTVSRLTDANGQVSRRLTEVEYYDFTPATTMSNRSWNPWTISISKAGCTTLNYSVTIDEAIPKTEVRTLSGC